MVMAIIKKLLVLLVLLGLLSGCGNRSQRQKGSEPQKSRPPSSLYKKKKFVAGIFPITVGQSFMGSIDS